MYNRAGSWVRSVTWKNAEAVSCHCGPSAVHKCNGRSIRKLRGRHFGYLRRYRRWIRCVAKYLRRFRQCKCGLNSSLSTRKGAVQIFCHKCWHFYEVKLLMSTFVLSFSNYIFKSLTIVSYIFLGNTFFRIFLEIYQWGFTVLLDLFKQSVASVAWGSSYEVNLKLLQRVCSCRKDCHATGIAFLCSCMVAVEWMPMSNYSL